MSHQDWTPVVLRKTYTKKEQAQKFGEIVRKEEPVKANKSNSNFQQAPSYKMDDQDYKPKVVTSEIAREIISLRTKAKLNQEQLALKVQLPLNVIKSYEKPSSTTVLNHQYLNKIKNFLRKTLTTQDNLEKDKEVKSQVSK